MDTEGQTDNGERETDGQTTERESGRQRGGGGEFKRGENKCLFLKGVGDIYRLTLKRPGLDSSVLNLSVFLNRPKGGGTKYVLKKF